MKVYRVEALIATDAPAATVGFFMGPLKEKLEEVAGELEGALVHVKIAELETTAPE